MPLLPVICRMCWKCHTGRHLKDSGNAGEKAFTYRLSSCTCLAGDVIGDYSFDKQIHVGDKLYFQDMAIYSMVKNNTF